MRIDWSKIKIFLRPGITDMRKQINGLSIITEADMKLNPLSGNLFLFCNRKRQILKCLYWDQNGFCLWQKRLECDKFPWPDNEETACELSESELNMLLSGIDFFHKHKKLSFNGVS